MNLTCARRFPTRFRRLQRQSGRKTLADDPELESSSAFRSFQRTDGKCYPRCQGAQMSSFFTLGHSNHDLEAWLALVRQHQIEVVVDTRSSPYSKYVPQFDKEPIQRSLEEAGVRYLFLGAELGGRPANPSYYDASGRVLYGRLRDDARFRAAIARLESGMERFRVALLCGEEDPAHCHRRLLIGRVLIERGHTMLHIRGDGRIETDEAVATASGKSLVGVQRELFAEIEEDKWRSTASVLPKKVPASSSAH